MSFTKESKGFAYFVLEKQKNSSSLSPTINAHYKCFKQYKQEKKLSKNSILQKQSLLVFLCIPCQTFWIV